LSWLYRRAAAIGKSRTKVVNIGVALETAPEACAVLSGMELRLQ
jgi:hypothetical protein